MRTNGYRNETGNGNIVDYRSFTLRSVNALADVGRRGTSLILKNDQFYPHTLSQIADACRRGGAVLHVVDVGYYTPEEMRMVARGGAVIHTPYQERVKMIGESVEYRPNVNMTLDEMRERDAEIRAVRNGNGHI